MTPAHDNYISLIKVGSTDYYIKDAEARSAIDTIEGKIKDGAHFLGKVDTSSGKTTPLTDGAHTNSIYIVGKTSAVTPAAGDFVFQTNGNTTIELVWDGVPEEVEEGETPAYTGTWREFGSTGTLKAFAFVDKGTFTYTPAGGVTVQEATSTTASVTDPTFTGTAATLTGSFTGEADQPLSVTGTPSGTVSKPSITVTESDASFDNLAVAVGTGADAETLTFSTTSKTFLTGATAALDAAPTFSGNSLTSTGTFTAEGTITMDEYTPEGSNSGTAVVMNPHTHSASFSGTEATVEVSPKVVSGS